MSVFSVLVVRLLVLRIGGIVRNMYVPLFPYEWLDGVLIGVAWSSSIDASLSMDGRFS
jgi:hypothetical protein